MKHTVEEIKLSNGARGLLIDIPGATVMSFRFQFRAGNRYARSKDIYETPHIMEHMAFGANAQFKNGQDFAAEFEKNGADYNAHTTDFSMMYLADCADFEWERIFELQQVAICQPKFNKDELEAEKGNVKSELTGYLNNHQYVLWPKVQQLLGEDVYTFWQSLQTIPRVTLEDIREHHKRTHTARNMCFVIAGKLQGRKSEIKRRLDAWELPEGERLLIPKDELTSANPTLIRRKEASNLTFGWAMTMPRQLSDEEVEAMRCVSHILTGTMHSRILGTARKKGVTYAIGSNIGIDPYSSSWDFTGEVNLETAEKLFDIIVREVGNVLDGKINEAELDAAKSYALGRYQMGAQTVAQVSNFYTGRYFADGFVKDYEKVPAAIRKTTRERMVKTAQEFFDSNAWVLAGVSSGEKEDIVALNSKLATLFEKR